MGPHQVDARSLELVERPGLGRRRAARARRRTRRRGGWPARPPAPARRAAPDRRSVRRSVAGTRPRRRARRVPAPGPPNARARRRPPRWAPAWRGRGATPADRVGLGVGGFGEGAMHAVAVVVGRRAVGGGSDEWMRELDARPDLEQPGFHRRVRCRHVETEGLGGTVEEHGVAEGLRGGGEDEQTGCRTGARGGAARSSVRSCRPPAGCRETRTRRRARGVVPGSRQLEQGERVAVALRDDLIAHGRIERAVHVVQQQRRARRCRRVHGWTAREARRGRCRHSPCARAHDRDPFGEQAAGDETENLSGGVVEPLRVVDDADERLLLGDLGEQRQRGQPDQEPVGAGLALSPNTVASASRCGAGRPSSRSSIGAQS